MTIWLQQRLTVMLGASLLGGALLWNGGALRAQDGADAVRASGIKTPRVKLTRDEAAKNFVALLQFFGEEIFRPSAEEPSAEMMSSFARKSEDESLGLLHKMAQQWKQPAQNIKVQSETSENAVVTVETSPIPASRELILIREGDSWGVDLLETYARWNNLKGAAKTETIARLSAQSNEARDGARRASCQSNLKRIALGIALYAQDYDEKYPLAKPWIDVVMPYVQSEQLFDCPSTSPGQRYGYAYNAKLSNKLQEQVSNTSQTVSLYETTILKRNAYGMGENRAYRHLEGANYAFADGHVKWFASTQSPSFNLKP